MIAQTNHLQTIHSAFVGQPHHNECNAERRSVCKGQRICWDRKNDCPTKNSHTPVMRLYHFTCLCHLPPILRDGIRKGEVPIHPNVVDLSKNPNAVNLTGCPSPASLYDPFGWIEMRTTPPDWVMQTRWARTEGVGGFGGYVRSGVAEAVVGELGLGDLVVAEDVDLLGDEIARVGVDEGFLQGLGVAGRVVVVDQVSGFMTSLERAVVVRVGLFQGGEIRWANTPLFPL